MEQEEPVKSWTVLIYANGNNDLEPEMRQAAACVAKIDPGQDMNIVIQLGRAKYELVKILREEYAPYGGENWHGVRRYCVREGKSALLSQLGEKNMADPKTLYDFLKWGIQQFPAKRHLLILSGHGFQFVGVMTDYSRKAPYIMGIPEMVRTINMAAQDTASQIDLLILDVCYYNFFEGIYELGKDKNHAVQNVITYLYNGPLQGLPYEKLIGALQQTSLSDDVQVTVEKIVDNLPFDLVAFAINHDKLTQIKGLFNELALKYWQSNPAKEDDRLDQLLFPERTTAAWYSLAGETFKAMLSTVTYVRRILEQDRLPLNVANVTTSNPALIARYHRLGFAQNNYWTYLLSKRTFSVDTPVSLPDTLQPLKLSSREIYTYISVMHPAMSREKKEKMVTELYRYKKWKT